MTSTDACGGEDNYTSNLSVHSGNHDSLEWWEKPNPWIHDTNREAGAPWLAINGGSAANRCDKGNTEEIPLPMDMPQIGDLNCALPRWRNQNRCTLGYPITEYEWRDQGDLNRMTLHYHAEIDQGFTKSIVKEAVDMGNKLVASTGSLDTALKAFREVEFRELSMQRGYINQNRSWIPHLADEMEEIMRIGVTATYHRPPPVYPRRRGLPYKDKDTLELIEKLWPDVKKGEFLYAVQIALGGMLLRLRQHLLH